MKVTGSLVVCMVAGLFTAGALVFNDGPEPTPPAAPAPQGTPAQIDIQGFAFSTAQVAPGGSLVVANHDGEEHTLTAADGSFDTGRLAGGTAVSIVAPTAAGAYQFVCTIHPSMTGQLVVA